MRIFSQGNPSNGNPMSPLGQSGALIPGLTPGLGSLPKPQSPVIQSPLDALNALEQWRAQAEDTRKHSARWALDQCPLKVWIEPYPESAQSPEDLAANTQALFAAMRQWEAATQGAIRFVLLPAAPGLQSSASGADMILTWDAQTTLGRDYEVGHTHRQVKGKRLTQATITLITQPLIDGHLNPQQRKQRLYTTVLHETGHALGLEHSDNHRDVMHYRGWQRSYLSENDIQRIRRLYELD